MRTLLLCIVIALAVLTAYILLNQHNNVYSESKSVVVAEQTWGKVCGGKVPDIKVTNLPNDQRGEANLKYLDTPAGRVYETCEVKIDSGWSGQGPKACAVLVHEWGHLAGEHHSSDPDSVMYPEITKRNVPSACR